MTDLRGERILVIKLGAFGDFVQALGPMAAIRSHHSRAHITLLTTAPYGSLAATSGYFDDIMIDHKPRRFALRGWLELRRKLNKRRFTRVYDLQNNDRTSLYLRLMHPRPEWVGAAKGASHRNASPERTAGRAFDGHVQTLALAGIKDVTPDDLSWLTGANDFDLRNPYVLLVPGCAPGRPEKRWPTEKFAVLAQNLLEKGYDPVVLGTAQESDLATIIRQSCPQAMDLTGKTQISDIPGLARNAAAAIGNDTGPMHIIAQTGCPALVLFSGHSHPERHAPLGARVKTLQRNKLAELAVEDVLTEITYR